MKKAAFFWSGGKDSALALFHIRRITPGLVIDRLITTLNSGFNRISMHGVRESLLDRQAGAIGLPLQKMWVPNAPGNGVYEEELHRVLSGIKRDGIDYVIFGDIFLEDLRGYRDALLARHNLTGVYPLWLKPAEQILDSFFSNGFAAVTCCVSSAHLDERWLGRNIDREFIDQLPATADPCGENGEFHSFCYAGPVFGTPIPFITGKKEYRPLTISRLSGGKSDTGFYYLDLL